MATKTVTMRSAYFTILDNFRENHISMQLYLMREHAMKAGNVLDSKSKRLPTH
jgi:hypothetical protein